MYDGNGNSVQDPVNKIDPKGTCYFPAAIDLARRIFAAKNEMYSLMDQLNY